MIPTLVQRLRYWHGDPDEVMTEAAYEIERLTAEKSQMQADFDRTCLDLQDYAGRMTAERDELQEKLDDLQPQVRRRWFDLD